MKKDEEEFWAKHNCALTQIHRLNKFSDQRTIGRKGSAYSHHECKHEIKETNETKECEVCADKEEELKPVFTRLGKGKELAP